MARTSIEVGDEKGMINPVINLSAGIREEELKVDFLWRNSRRTMVMRTKHPNFSYDECICH